MKKKGFTLVELLIVVIIIAVLAAIAIPKFVNSGARSKESSLKANLKLVRNAVQLFQNDSGCFPNSLADLAVTTAPSGGKKAGTTTVDNCTVLAVDWKGPYLQTVERDPISGAVFVYDLATVANLGRVSTSATGNDSSGIAFSTY